MIMLPNMHIYSRRAPDYSAVATRVTNGLGFACNRAHSGGFECESLEFTGFSLVLDG